MCFSLLALTDLFAGFEWCEPLKPWMILYTNCWAFNLKFDACQGQFYILTVCLQLKQDTTPNKTNIYNNKAEDETIVIMWMQHGGTCVCSGCSGRETAPRPPATNRGCEESNRALVLPDVYRWRMLPGLSSWDV